MYVECGTVSVPLLNAVQGMQQSVQAGNRQLHPSEARLIRDNARRYAAQRGISREQAEAELTQQALRQVDSAWAQRSDNNTVAASFLQSIAKDAGNVAVGGGTVFDARGTTAYSMLGSRPAYRSHAPQ